MACQRVAYVVAGLGGVDYPVEVINNLIAQGFSVRTPWWNSQTPADNFPAPIPGQPGQFNPYIDYGDADPGSLTLELGGSPTAPATMTMNLGAPNTPNAFVNAVFTDLTANFDRDDLIVLIGHGLGGNSVLQVARQIEAANQEGVTDLDIDLLALLDPMGFLDPANSPDPDLLGSLTSGAFFQPFLDPNVASSLSPTYVNGQNGLPLNDQGLIPTWRGDMGVVPASVRYLYNRWQTNAILPFEFTTDGTLASRATGDLQTDFGITSQLLSNTTAVHPATTLEQLFGLQDRLGNSTAHVDPNFPADATIQANLIQIATQLADEQNCLVVTTTADLVGGQPATGSLRAAMLTANRLPGLNVITFDIEPRDVAYSIRLDAPLPLISDPVTIDAATQPGFAGRPIVQVNGRPASVADGFVVQTGNVTLRALNIVGFDDAGVRMNTGTGHRLEGNWIGTDLAGSTSFPNGVGVLAEGASKFSIGGAAPGAGNLISGNIVAGIYLIGPSTGDVLIQGNRIGTDAAGASAVVRDGSNALQALQNAGIAIDRAGAVLIGGVGVGEGNVISGNYVGVLIAGASAGGGVNVQGNRIGTDPAGAAAVGNIVGIYLNNSPGHRIGGATPGAGNVISGNASVGVEILGPGATGNQLVGNTIGLAADGRTPLPQATGVFIQDASANVVSTNVISGNSVAGVYVLSRIGTARDNQIISNRIGLAASGGGGPGNGAYGVLFFNANRNNAPRRGAGANSNGPAGIRAFRDFQGAIPADPTVMARRGKLLKGRRGGR